MSIGAYVFLAWLDLGDPSLQGYDYQLGRGSDFPGGRPGPNWRPTLAWNPQGRALQLAAGSYRGQDVVVFLRARNSVGPSAGYAQVTVRVTLTHAHIQAPYSVPNLRATPGIGQIRYDWDGITSDLIVRYDYEFGGPSLDGVARPIAGSGSWRPAYLTLASLPGSSAPLRSGVRHQFRVRAVSRRPGGPRPGESFPDVVGAWSRTVNAYPLAAASAPARPNLLGAVAGAATADLSWAALGDPSVTAWQFRTRLGAGAWSVWQTLAVAGATATATGARLTGLANGVAIGVQIRAGSGPADARLWSPASNERTVTPQQVTTDFPDRPEAFAACRLGDDDPYVYRAAWRETDERLVRYELRATTVSGRLLASNDDIAADATEASVEVDTSGQRSIRLRLRAIGLAGSGPETWRQLSLANSRADGRIVYGAAPLIDFEATGQRRQIALAWQAATYSRVSGYEYSLDGGSTWTDIPGPGANARTRTAATLTGLADGTDYSILLRAKSTLSPGYGPSSSATVTTLPAAVAPPPAPKPAQPASLGASFGDRRARLAWTRSNDATLTGYQYRQKTGTASTGAWGAWTNVAGSSARTASLNVTGLANGSGYCFQVRAVNAAGAGPASDQACGTPNPALPGAPTSLTGSPGTAEANLAWGAASGIGILRYEARSRPGTAGAWTAWATISSSAADLDGEVTGLMNGRTYYFQVRAVNAAGAGPASAAGPAGGITPTGAPPALAAPTLTLLATSYLASGSQWQIRFRVSAVPGAAYYQYRGAKGADPTGLWIRLTSRTLAINSAAYTTGSTIHFEVRAVAGSRQGPAGSLSVSLAFPAPPAPAITLLASRSQQPNATMAWSTSQPAVRTGYPAITGYQYQQRRSGAAWPSAWTDAGGGAGTGARNVTADNGRAGQITVELRVRAVSSGRSGNNRYSAPSNTISKFIESR